MGHRRPAHRVGVPALSERERELLVLLSAGCGDDSMAVQLGISVRTVRRRISAIMTRLGARSRFQAGAKAAHEGWLVPRRPQSVRQKAV